VSSEGVIWTASLTRFKSGTTLVVAYKYRRLPSTSISTLLDNNVYIGCSLRKNVMGCVFVFTSPSTQSQTSLVFMEQVLPLASSNGGTI
jgi:hypothetical protein